METHTRWEKAREVYTNLDPRVRLFVQLMGVAVGTIIVFKILKAVKQAQEDTANRNETQSTANELQVLNQNPATKQTITTGQANSYANKIFASMNGKGTYEDEIVDVFKKIKNDADFLAISKSFGTRTIESRVWLVEDFRGTLIQCLADELSSGYVTDINNILKSKKIKYRV
jgi:mannitol-specific phosphotransferase system IIBC component